MALLTTQQVVRAGVTPSYATAAGGGDTFTAGNDVFMHIKNGGGAPINVTIVTTKTISGHAVADTVVSVTNAQERMIGPFAPDLYADGTTGLVSVTYSGVTSVTVGIFQLDQG